LILKGGAGACASFFCEADNEELWIIFSSCGSPASS